MLSRFSVNKRFLFTIFCKNIHLMFRDPKAEKGVILNRIISYISQKKHNAKLSKYTLNLS